MKGQVYVEGDGIASVCVTRLLRDAGIPVVSEKKPRPQVAAILLSQATQHLLQEIFTATSSNNDLFEGFIPIRRRIVLWGTGQEPIDVPHFGLVAPEGVLLQRLWEQASSESDQAGSTTISEWTIKTLASSTTAKPPLRIGDRHAHIALAQLQISAPRDACWIESVNDGWLFLLPRGGTEATLMAVGDEPQTSLQSSKLISHQLNSVAPTSAVIAASPQLAATLAEPGMIACGSAAMNFDPLCGEGAGNAVREAFLAAAVVRAALQGESAADLTRHYEDRLWRGFARHLEVCLQFYQTGGTSDFWREQVDALHNGMPHVTALLSQSPAHRYRLVERDLVSIHNR